MSGPWESYQPQESTGPWAKYNAPQVSSVMDMIKSAPRALVSGLGGVLSDTGAAESHAMSQPQDVMPTKEESTAGLEKGVTGELYKPQTTAGKISTAGIEQLANPLTYLGPGSAALKIGGGILSGAGSESAGQATEGSKWEPIARLLAGAAGGVTAGKTLGPSSTKAIAPTLEELKASANKGYQAARDSGVEFNPKGIGDFASGAQQELTTGPKYGFTGGPDGTAPKTLGLLDRLQNPPEGATIIAANMDTLRKNIGNIAGETKDFKPTPDAKAAMVLKERLAQYMENPPADHIVAGDPSEYVGHIKQANGDYAAASRLGTFDSRINKATNETDRQIAGSLDARIKSNVGRVLDNPKQLRGLSQAEKDQIQLINSGSFTSNIMRQLGRGGAGVIPMGAHIAGAIASGGASIPASAAIGIPLYAARKASEAMTVSRANKLAEMLAQRSPLYQDRLKNVAPVSNAPQRAAIIRSLLQSGVQ